MAEIVGIGDASVDIMIEVDHLPSHDEKVGGREVGKFPGGMIANSCAAAATFGGDVAAICKVGNDNFGEITTEDLRGRGVDVSRMVKAENAGTYYGIAHLDATGEKALTVVYTDYMQPLYEEIDMGFVRQARFIHMSGGSFELLRKVFHALEGTGINKSVDIEPSAAKRGPEGFEELFGLIEYSFINSNALFMLTGERNMERAAQFLLAKGVETVIITRGAMGSDVFGQKNVHIHTPAFKVDAEDTTGAGDCFSGVFLAARSMGFSLEDAAMYASAGAAMSIRKAGSRSALASCEEIKSFIDLTMLD